MFLLFPYTLSTLPSFPFIYIPICFYYFCIALFLPLHFSDLHSNMFLLFPGCGISNKAQKEQFTFQYVSIISRFAGHFFHLLLNIYIPICFYYFHAMMQHDYGVDFNLHSNMFLLFRTF